MGDKKYLHTNNRDYYKRIRKCKIRDIKEGEYFHYIGSKVIWHAFKVSIFNNPFDIISMESDKQYRTLRINDYKNFPKPELIADTIVQVIDWI